MFTSESLHSEFKHGDVEVEMVVVVVVECYCFILLLGPLNRDCLSFCVTIFTFRGYRSFRLCKTFHSQAWSFVVVILWLKLIRDKNCGSVTQNCILISKTQIKCNISVFLTFFLMNFLSFSL